MAIQAQLADGRVLEFPDGTEPAVIQQAVKRMLAQEQPAPQPAAPTEQPGFFERFAEARQVLSETPSTAQIARSFIGQSDVDIEERERALAALPPERRALLESINPAEAALIGMGRGFTKIGRAVGIADPETEFEKQAFEQLKTQQPVSATTGEIIGETAPFVAPALGVAALPARAAQIGGMTTLGALEAGAIARGEGRDVEEQIKTAGVGALVAGGLEVAIPIVGRIGGKIVRKILGKAPTGAVVDASGRPSQEILDALAESGQTFDDVVKQAQRELRGKALEPREAARKAFLESQGLDPTRAQVSRNAADFQAQQEAAKTSNRVRNALEKQEAVLTSRFNNAILDTGGKSSAATSSVADALTEKATRLDQEIGDLYRAAETAAPGAKNIKFNKLTETLKKMEGADRRAGGNISAIIGDMQSKGILDKQKNIIGNISVETAEDLRKLTNELYDPANPFGNMLLRKVKDSLDDDVFRASGKDFFKQARQAKASFESELARAKISKFDSRKNNLVRDILENKIDPDLLTERVVFGKGWRSTDLKQLKDYISTDDVGKAAFDDMRAEVMQKIKDKSFIGPVDDAGFQSLSRDKLQRVIDSVGRKKLNVLFSPQENKFLRDMLEIAKIREPVRGTALGRGPSAQAIGKLEQKLKDLPVLGGLVDFINIDAQGRAVIKAKPTPIKPPRIEAPEAIRAITPAAAALTAQQEQQ
jgi:hypothetical protein